MGNASQHRVHPARTSVGNVHELREDVVIVYWELEFCMPARNWKCSIDKQYHSTLLTQHDSNARDWLWQRLVPWQRAGDYFSLLMTPDGKTLRVSHIANEFDGMFNPTVLLRSVSAKEMYDQIEPYLYMIRTKDTA